MGEHKAGSVGLRELQELAADTDRNKRSSSHLVLKIVGLAALALVAAGILTSLDDIRRYIRISRM